MEEYYSGHVLAVPYPSQGHISPLLQLCKRFASKGLKATLATTTFISNNFPYVSSSSSAAVHIDTISDGYDDGGFALADSISTYLQRLESVGSKTLTQLIVKHSNTRNPISCIVYDPFLPWALKVAKRFGLVAAAFFTQSCVVNYIYCLVHHGKLSLPVSSSSSSYNSTRIFSMDGLPELELRDMPSFISVPGSYPAYFEMVLNQFSNIHKADFVLLNSFYDIEKEEENLLSKIHPAVLTIGPTIPSVYLDKRLDTDTDYSLQLFTPAAVTCTQWLTTKPPGSVVYVSFGSMANLSATQMKELAWGLNQTNFYFLWVIRASEQANLPSNFKETTAHKGLIVEWSPQLEVLSNRAIGCFFSHCGWNSTLEGLSLGVAMVAMPQWTDQPTNAKYVESVWKVGMRVKVGEEEGIVRRDEVERCVKEVMEGERGREMKKNAKKMKELAVKAVSVGGTSDINIDLFLSKLITN